MDTAGQSWTGVWSQFGHCLVIFANMKLPFVLLVESRWVTFDLSIVNLKSTIHSSIYNKIRLLKIVGLTQSTKKFKTIDRYFVRSDYD